MSTLTDAGGVTAARESTVSTADVVITVSRLQPVVSSGVGTTTSLSAEVSGLSDLSLVDTSTTTVVVVFDEVQVHLIIIIIII